jgi:acetyl esterase/lipase
MLPVTQRFFLPPSDRLTELIETARDTVPPGEPVRYDVEYDRDLFRQYHLDVYGPLDDEADGDLRGFSGAAPVIVFYHGGSWLRGDKVMIRVVDRFLRRMREEGWFVVSINYTTSALRGIGGPVDQAATALEWVYRNAPNYGWDPARIGLYGVSSGGHVALMAVSDTNGSAHSPDQSLEPAFVFAESSPTDLIAMREGDAFENSGGFRFFPEWRLRYLSPITYVSPAVPPVLLFHGDRDETVHIDQSRSYADALTAAGGEVTFVSWTGGNHAFLNYTDRQWYRQETVALEWMREQFS